MPHHMTIEELRAALVQRYGERSDNGLAECAGVSLEVGGLGVTPSQVRKWLSGHTKGPAVPVEALLFRAPFAETSPDAFSAVVCGEIWSQHTPSGRIASYKPDEDAGNGHSVVDTAIALDQVHADRYAALAMTAEAEVARRWSEGTQTLYAARDLISEQYCREIFPGLPKKPEVEDRIAAIAASAGVTIDQAEAVLGALTGDLSERAHRRREGRSTEPGHEKAYAARAAVYARITNAILTIAPDSLRARQLRGEE